MCAETNCSQDFHSNPDVEVREAWKRLPNKRGYSLVSHRKYSLYQRDKGNSLKFQYIPLASSNDSIRFSANSSTVKLCIPSKSLRSSPFSPLRAKFRRQRLPRTEANARTGMAEKLFRLKSNSSKLSLPNTEDSKECRTLPDKSSR
jgi:hypothetical protein